MTHQYDAFCKIRDFTNFSKKKLGRDILKYISQSLTNPGENYGSNNMEVKVDECYKV